MVKLIRSMVRPGRVATVSAAALDGRAAPGGRARQELRAGAADLAEELHGVEAGVGQQQHGAV
jgi:hypothetical protein